MKKKFIILFIIFIFAGLGLSYADLPEELQENKIEEKKPEDKNKETVEYKRIENRNLRGVWVASVLNINYPTYRTTNSALLKIEADNIIESAQNSGFNAIFLQVRPTADSLYKSKIFPWSKYLTGQEGLAPANNFDPLSYYITECHKRNIEVHAWVNPYRITKKTKSEQAYTTDKLSLNHPARLHPEYVVSYQGNLYFDPALPEVRDLITLGVKEIIDNYKVDGIHFDDYFYPAKEFDDKKSYSKYGNGQDLASWRRDNVNKLVKQVYNTVHKDKKDIDFGISPFGIWANKNSLIKGSDTAGSQSYFDHYADSLYWINHSIVDYISPQIYWHMGFKIADFKTLTDWWDQAVKNSDVKLYVGLAAYRADQAKQDSPWYRNYELRRQLKYLENKQNVDGFIAFSIASIRDSNRIYNAFRGYGKIKSNAKYSYPLISLYGRSKNQYVGGLVHPILPATLNGKVLQNVSDKGFFGAFIENKNNKFSLINNNKTVNKIYKPYNPYHGSWKPSNKTLNSTKNYEFLNTQIKNGAIILAKIKKDEANLRLDKNPRNGSMELVPKAVTDEIAGAYGSMIKLTSGRYVESSNIDFIYKKASKYSLFSPKYIKGENVDKIEFDSNIKPFVKAYLKDNSLIISFMDEITLSPIIIPENAMIKNYSISKMAGRNLYTLTLNDINRLGGYYVEYTGNKVIVNIKHKKTITDNSKPLEGFDIVLDAGHGGTDTGALGLLSTAYAEKDVTLDMTLKLNQKLKNLGANVILTRDKDQYVSLHDRLKFVYNYKPDIFISIHANSCGLSTDVNKIKGFSVYYSKDIAANYSKMAQRELCMNTSCTFNKVRTNDFYVIRGTHCPSVLLETGFMPNPEDFDWLCDDKKQDEFVSELTRTILLYFEK